MGAVASGQLVEQRRAIAGRIERVAERRSPEAAQKRSPSGLSLSTRLSSLRQLTFVARDSDESRTPHDRADGHVSDGGITSRRPPRVADSPHSVEY